MAVWKRTGRIAWDDDDELVEEWIDITYNSETGNSEEPQWPRVPMLRQVKEVENGHTK